MHNQMHLIVVYIQLTCRNLSLLYKVYAIYVYALDGVWMDLTKRNEKKRIDRVEHQST